MSIPAVTQELIDNTNTEAIERLESAMTNSLSSIQTEREDRIHGDEDTLESAKEYTDEQILKSEKGIVKTVNGNGPDDRGNVELTKVPLSDNLYTSDMVIDDPESGYVFRTTGGDASVTNGEGYLSRIRGLTETVDGVLVSAKPTAFVSHGFNQFKPSDVLGGYAKFNETGKIVVDTTNAFKIAYAHVAGGLSKGYTVHATEGAVTRVGWCSSIPSIGSTARFVELEATEDSTVDGCKNYKFTAFGNGELFDDGYFCIETTSIEKMSVHPHWSGPANWRDEGLEDYVEYSSSTVLIPTVNSEGAELPIAEYGIPSVGAVCDEFDFDAKKYYKRIGFKTFSAENIEYVKSYGTEYVDDGVASIYYVLKEADRVVFDLPNSFSNLVTVCDYGTEEFIGSSVSVRAKMSYLPNLRDKLRTDVVTISEQNLTEVQKKQIQSNLNVVDASETTKSVNGNIPDAKGNVTIESVEYANNLRSTDNIADVSDFIFRTTGGSQSINSGMAELTEVRGNIIDPIHVEESIEYTKSEKERFDVVIDKEKWIESPFGGTPGTYTFVRDVGNWKYNNTVVDLATYGITIVSKAGDLNVIDGDKVMVNYTIYGEAEDITRFLDCVKVEASHLKFDFINDTFKASDKAQSQSKGTTETYVFSYTVAEGWKCDGTSISPRTIDYYGIDLHSTPANNDAITVSYTKLDLGHIFVSKPTLFKSVGQNQFDRDTMVISNATISDGGKIVPAEEGNFVAYAYVTGSLSQDDERGYTVYNQYGGISKVGFVRTAPSMGTSGIDLGMTYEDKGGKSWDLVGEYVAPFDKLVNIHGFEDDGYICVACSEVKHLNVHPRWSGYENLSFNVYTESTITIPTSGTIMQGEEEVAIELPTKTLGIPRVGDVYDVLSLNKHTYIKNIDCIPYSKSNLDMVIALTDVYTYDDTIILYKLDTPIVYKIDESYSATYEVNDFGTERYYGTDVPVKTAITYGDNLRDKLRTDVVTYSDQSTLNKTESQKSQARKNIGAASDAEVAKSVNNELPDSNGNVTVRKVALAENLYSTDNVIDTESFYVRTAGGDASISNGGARISSIGGGISIDEESGEITIATPHEFKAIGFNAFDKESMVISGYNTFNLAGKIVYDSSYPNYKLCYVRMPVSDNRGWQIYNPNDSIIKVGWCNEIPTEASTITALDKNNILSETDNDVYVYDQNGYLVIVTTDVDILCVHPRWSGRSNWHDAEGLNDYEEYTENTIAIPTKSTTGESLPLDSYGMPAIDTVCDTIDVDAQQYIKKIGYLPYTEENLEYAYGNSDTVIFDSDKILYVLRNFVTYDISIKTEYEVCDYGTEMFNGSSVELKTTIIYGDNLRDKLRTDVVTYSDQSSLNKTEAQMKQARKNIGAASDVDAVKSVNGIRPVQNGNVLLVEVPYANNLVSTDNQEIKSKFVFRTSGGDASITNGSAYLSYVEGYANSPQHITEEIKIAAYAQERLNPTIDKDTWFASDLGGVLGEYTFTYSATKWTYYDKDSKVQRDIELSTYGIAVQNYCINGDKLVITSSEHETETEGVEKIKTVSIVANEQAHFGIELVKETFRNSELGNSSNQYRLIYESSKWNIYKMFNNAWTIVKSDVTPSEYGFTVKGTPIADDSAIVNYTKKYDEVLKISKPTGFKSIGFNQFNKGSDEFPDKMYFEGYTIDSDGNIVAAPGKCVAYVHVVGGLDRGYQIFNGLTALDKVYWSATKPTTSTTGLSHLLTENVELSEDSTIAAAGNKLIKCYLFDNDGYLVIATNNVDSLCVHPRWSGTSNWRDSEGFNDYEDYTESTITFPLTGMEYHGIDYTIVDLPLKTYGIPSIGDVEDKFDLENLSYTQSISSIEYTPQNLSNVVSMGVPFSYDMERILFEMEKPIVYRLEATLDNEYVVCDYGTEEFLETDVEASNAILYGESLKDKLRTNVLTISEQSLSDSSKEQIGYNLGMRYRLVTKELADATVTVGGTDIDAKTCVVDDFTINTVEVDSDEKPVYIYLPKKSKDGRARDFIVRIAVTSAAAPSIAFVGQDESIDYESADEEWATIEPGSNLFSFTETIKENA